NRQEPADRPVDPVCLSRVVNRRDRQHHEADHYGTNGRLEGEKGLDWECGSYVCPNWRRGERLSIVQAGGGFHRFRLRGRISQTFGRFVLLRLDGTRR